MTKTLKFEKKWDMVYAKRYCYYSIIDEEDTIHIGIIKQDKSSTGDDKWYWVPESNFMYGIGTLSEIANKISELNSGSEPQPVEVKPAIRHLDLDD